MSAQFTITPTRPISSIAVCGGEEERNHTTAFTQLGINLLAVSCTCLPGADVRDALAEGPLVDEAELECVAADLAEVVEEGAEGGERVRRGEERHVAELDEHLQVVLERALVLPAKQT